MTISESRGSLTWVHVGDLHITAEFMHAYPADLKRDGQALHQLLNDYRVAFVDMGHTHYNELANDGTTMFATTRSTGQLEEGPIGFSLASLHHGVVRWRFKPLRSSWPFAMILGPNRNGRQG